MTWGKDTLFLPFLFILCILKGFQNDVKSSKRRKGKAYGSSQEGHERPSRELHFLFVWGGLCGVAACCSCHKPHDGVGDKRNRLCPVLVTSDRAEKLGPLTRKQTTGGRILGRQWRGEALVNVYSMNTNGNLSTKCTFISFYFIVTALGRATFQRPVSKKSNIHFCW